MLLNDERAFRKEEGGGTWRLGVIWKRRRKRGRMFWGGNSICKGRVSGKGVKHLWENEGTALLNAMGQWEVGACISGVA